jgi:CelD/BcsL family acetyltransferase involved in cellulose biosynthesis
MQVERRPLRSLTGDDVEQWRALAARAVEPNPYFEPGYVLPAARHIARRDQSLLVVRDDDGWVACLPLTRAARFRKVPGPALLSWMHTHCFLGTPLIAPDRVVEAWRLILRDVGADRTAGFFGLEQLGDGGPVADGLHAALAAEGRQAILYERFERAALWRREDGDYLNPALGGKRRREMRRQRRQLEEELGGPSSVRDRSGEDAALDAFLALEASGWKGREGTALDSAGHREFFAEMARGFAAEGRLQLLSLDVGDTTVAMKCNLLAQDAIFCFKIARDERYSRFSPGVQLELENADVFHDTTRAVFTDSCAVHDNQMINRLWRDRRPVATVLVPAPHAVGRVSRMVVRGALRSRHLLGRDP